MKKHLISYSLVFLALQPALGMAMDGQQPGSSNDQQGQGRRHVAQPSQDRALTELEQEQARAILKSTLACMYASNAVIQHLNGFGELGGQNLPLARTLFEQVASNPADPEVQAAAQFHLGFMYLNGKGGRVNLPQARSLLRQVTNNPIATTTHRVGAEFGLASARLQALPRNRCTIL